jgi:hypothetical protein
VLAMGLVCRRNRRKVLFVYRYIGILAIIFKVVYHRYIGTIVVSLGSSMILVIGLGV